MTYSLRVVGSSRNTAGRKGPDTALIDAALRSEGGNWRKHPVEGRVEVEVRTMMHRCCQAAIVALLVTLVGCGADATSVTDQTSTPATPPASSTPATPPASAALSADALLTATQMPAWNGAMGWIEQELPPGGSALGVCVLPTAASLGAVDVLTRDFVAAGVPDPETTPDPTWPASYATNRVALFPDSVTADAALRAWEAAAGTCTPGPSITSDPASFRISDLPAGSTWAVSARDTNDVCPECMRFEFLGFTAKGSAVSTVGFSLTGQDANYEGDPLTMSLDAAQKRLP